MTGHWTSRHRGPYRLCAVRAGAKPGQVKSDWLPGQTSADDVEAEAMALLADARDAIRQVTVWSVRKRRFVWTYEKAVHA